MVDAPTFPRLIDSSMLSAMICMQRFKREYIDRLAPAAISPDLHCGGAMAKAFETYRKAVFAEGVSEDAAMLRTWRAFTSYWGDYEPPEKKQNKNYVNAWGAVEAYLREYPPLTDSAQPLIKSDGSPAIEFTFTLPLPLPHPDTGEPMLYCGRLDMLALYGRTAYVLDEKTTGAFRMNWSEQWEIRSQFLGYTYAARQYGYPVKGAIVRGIALLKSEYRFLQAIVHLPEWQVERWYRQMLRTISRAIDCYREGYFDFNYGDACSMYNGCAYQPLCTSETPERWYEDFAERTWNPLAKDPTSPTKEEIDAVYSANAA